MEFRLQPGFAARYRKTRLKPELHAEVAMKHPLLGGLTLKALARKVWRAANEDDFFGSAAKLPYYFLLALFPMLIFLTSLVGFLPGVQEKILLTLAEVAPSQAMVLVMRTLNDVVSKRSRGLLSFGV